MASTPIGCWVRNGGSWKRIVMAHVYDGGAWRECQKIHSYNGSYWRVHWVDNIRALYAPSFQKDNWDPTGPPYSTGAGWKLFADGHRETFDTPPDSLNNYSSSLYWLPWDVGRTYQVRFTQVRAHDVQPTTGTWLSGSTYEIKTTRTVAGSEDGEMTVEYRRSDGTPTGVLASHIVRISCENGSD